MYLLSSNPPPRRSGVILLIVVVMLALFLVVGLSFMLYAESEASASRIYREAFNVNYDRADEDANSLLSWALGQLIYDVSDDGEDVYSAMRGNSLARNMFGWNYQYVSTLPNTPPDKNRNANNNTIAFNGYGKLGAPVNPSPFGNTVDDRILLNYTYFPNYNNPSQSFVRDPERVGVRSGGSNPLQLPFQKVNTTNSQPFSGGFNVPYTYPDLNNVFLGAIRAGGPSGTPQVITPSFHRAPPGDLTVSPFYVANPNRSALTNPGPWLDTDPNHAYYKYLVLRPRPADMYYDPANPTKSFPLPASDTGDVQNLPGSSGGPDSYWMDLNFPVKTTRGGTKFKPLFAFLVVDLDGRVNVNVHGNRRGVDQTTMQPIHVSSQGVGKDEINLDAVLTAPTGVGEAQNIFGNQAANIIGRYGPNYVPAGGVSRVRASYPDFDPGMLRPYMTRVDYDGVDENTGYPTQRFTSQTAFSTMPSYTAGYDSLMVTQAAALQNPLMYNVLAAGRPGNDDKPWSIAENLYYLIGSATGPNYQRSALYQAGIKKNLDLPGIRHMLTTTSFDLDTPGARPWVTNPSNLSAPMTNFVLPTPTDPNDWTQYHPHAQAPNTGGFTLNQVPSQVNTSASPIRGSDFLADDGRCSVLPRLDLNRKLAPYFNQTGVLLPIGLPFAGSIPQQGTVAYAIWDRQKFAADILERLMKATGAVPMPIAGGPDPATPEQQNARRYLAQLAVNIVDYIDDDEFITEFPWFKNPVTGAVEYVYGVESPKVVLNEIYAELRNDPADNGQQVASSPFQLHFWIEFFNTRKAAQLPAPNGRDYNTDPNTGDNRGFAQLKNSANQPVYRLRIYDETTMPPNVMRDFANTTGDVVGVTAKLEVKDWDQTASGQPLPPGERVKIHPHDPANQNGVPNQNVNGYYVVASQQEIEGVTPVVEPTNRLPAGATTSLSYTMGPTTNPPTPPRHTVVLQRLLYPTMRENPDPLTGVLDPNFPRNVYVTVDYVANVQTWDAVRVLSNPNPLVPSPNPNYMGPDTRNSKARTQPFAAATAAPRAPAGSPPHTFFQPNVQSGQYDWMVHLDRPPISLMEMLHVSAFKPQEVTQTFMDTAGHKWQHVAPWTLDPGYQPTGSPIYVGEQSRLSRALEYFTVGERNHWTYLPDPLQSVPFQPSSGGRKAGMINPNTVWDLEVLTALADAKQAGAPNNPNYFDQTQVLASWNSIGQRRSPPPPPTANFGVNAPFMSFANPGPLDTTQPPKPAPAQNGEVPEFPSRSGIAGTFLGSDFKVVSRQANAYLNDELLMKIGNHITPRSNVYAVYLTVGFFEVMDDTVRPVKLGAEIRARNGIPIRHKMFAIIDRTNIGVTDPAVDVTGGLKQGGKDTFVIGGNTVLKEKRQFFMTAERVESTTSPQMVSSSVTQEFCPPPASVPVVLTVLGGMSNPMYYDGQQIDLPPTFTLYADVGIKQETLTGCSLLPSGQISVPNGFRLTHAAGFTLSYLRPANPGPQPDFSYDGDAYKQVIPYTVIIQ